MTYNEENNKIYESYIRRNFLIKKDELIGEERIPSVEIILTSKCDLKCQYCYLNMYRDKLYPQELDKKDIILNNLKIFLDYLFKEKFICKLEIFSGELFSQDVGYEALNLIYEYVVKTPNVIKSICIPSNMNFIGNEQKTNMVEDILEKFESILVPIHISCSFDGPYLLENRQFCNNKENRNEEYYNKLFNFIKKHHVGLHPMLSANGIEKWPQNYDWFIEKIKQYNLGG